MGRRRRTVVVIGLLVCLPLALLGAFPAVAWRMADARLSGGRDEAAWTSPAAAVHRGVRVRITGTVQGVLSPGVSSPILLGFMNPNRHMVSMRRVKVTVTRVIAPQADGTHRCTVADFEVRQMPRRTLRLPPRRTVDLAWLGAPVQGWPLLSMRNLPVNQDGCKGAQLELKFRAHRVRR
jgi:hypothetical protein